MGGVSKGEGQEMCSYAKAALYLTASFSHGLSTVHTQDSSPDVIQQTASLAVALSGEYKIKQEACCTILMEQLLTLNLNKTSIVLSVFFSFLLLFFFYSCQTASVKH